jgi:hypothetical protein
MRMEIVRVVMEKIEMFLIIVNAIKILKEKYS